MNLIANRINFLKRLFNSEKLPVQSPMMTVCEDMRTNTGRNCKRLHDICFDLGIIYQDNDLSDINPNIFRQNP